MTHDYKAALECFNSGYGGDPDFLEFTHGKTIRHALRIADKLMHELTVGEDENDYEFFRQQKASLDKRISEIRAQLKIRKGRNLNHKLPPHIVKNPLFERYKDLCALVESMDRKLASIPNKHLHKFKALRDLVLKEIENEST